MWTEIKTAYRDSARVAVQRPLLFALPLIAEFTQHVVEYRVGMFDSMEAMKAVSDDASRMGFGYVKVFALIVIAYWVTRALANLEGAKLRVLGDRASLILFVGVMLWNLLSGLSQEYGGALLGALLPTRWFAAAAILAFVLLVVIDTCLVPWKVGAALGNAGITIPASLRIMGGRNVLWSLVFIILAALPLMVLHYALNVGAAGRPAALLWSILALDALVVGYLGIVLVAIHYRIARRAAGRAGLPLIA